MSLSVHFIVCVRMCLCLSIAMVVTSEYASQNVYREVLVGGLLETFQST